MRWNLDTTHAEVEFAVKHLMISTVKGRFKSFSGTGVVDQNAVADTALGFTFAPSGTVAPATFAAADGEDSGSG